MPTAIVIDGAYFLRRFHHSFPDLDSKVAEDVALGVMSLATFHVTTRLQANPVLQAIEGGSFELWATSPFRAEESPELYRIFFYDCPPLEKRLQRPISGRAYNLKSTDEAILRRRIHQVLSDVRKVALRLGRLNESFSGWRPKPDSVKRWISDKENFIPTDDDFEIDVIQKGVDMRLGLDIAAMAFKKQVDQIILVAGDADFVPVAKLARREGIDVVLDTMFGQAAKDLMTHVDGVRNCKLVGRPRHHPVSE